MNSEPNGRFFSRLLVSITVVATFCHGFLSGSLPTPTQMAVGATRLPDFLAMALPPDSSRLVQLSMATLVTLEIAVLGTAVGVAFGLPLSIWAARGFAPTLARWIARGLVGFCRTVPDVVWGLFAVVMVGLGPPAGIVAVAIHTVGVFGRLFADSLEDVDDRARQLLWASGWPQGLASLVSKLPEAGPPFWSSVGYALESAVRSSVVIGVVGAGGIGIELTTSMALLRYDEVATIVILVFLIVLAVERLASALRNTA